MSSETLIGYLEHLAYFQYGDCYHSLETDQRESIVNATITKYPWVQQDKLLLASVQRYVVGPARLTRSQ